MREYITNRFGLCPYRFKSSLCGYSGDDTGCDKTIIECKNKGNVDRFGGSYDRESLRLPTLLQMCEDVHAAHLRGDDEFTDWLADWMNDELNDDKPDKEAKP